MDRGEQAARLAETSASSIVWRGRGAAAEVQCTVDVIAEIAELATTGYRRYPWGGVEIGGVFFGKEQSGTVHISRFRPVQCEHQHGPAFVLSDKDCAALELLLAGAAEDEELAGLMPAGWYQTVSRRDLGLSEEARTVFHRFFPQPWQITMIVGRSKQEPLSFGIFVRDSHGRVEMHSTAQEVTLENLQQRRSRAAFTEAPALPSTPPAQPEPAATIAAPSVEPPPAEAAEPPYEAPQYTPPQYDPAALLAAEPAPPDNPFKFFGLKADAFCGHPNTQFFYPSPQHREALAVLFHRIRSHTGFLVLLGEPGTGKSMVLECLRDLLKTHATHFAVLLNSKITVAEFFELIAHDFQLRCASPTKTATLIALNEYLLERSRAGQTTALVVDSAEKLPTEVLEEIELLGNLENRDGRLLQVVFAAQPGFERRLDAPQLRGLKQRMMLRARLEPLNAAETAAYIQHRMAVAGARNPSVFPAGVLAEIHRRTQGVPRWINALCGLLLATCWELQVATPEMSMLEGIADDLGWDGPAQP